MVLDLPLVVLDLPGWPKEVGQEPPEMTRAGSTPTKAGVDQEPPEARQKDHNKHK